MFKYNAFMILLVCIQSASGRQLLTVVREFHSHVHAVMCMLPGRMRT